MITFHILLFFGILRPVTAGLVFASQIKVPRDFLAAIIAFLILTAHEVQQLVLHFLRAVCVPLIIKTLLVHGEQKDHQRDCRDDADTGPNGLQNHPAILSAANTADHITIGGNYGWPNCWNEGEGSDCAGTQTAVAFFEPHSSANGLDFYAGDQFPAEYQNNAFVAIFGTFLTDGVQTGIARVQLTPDGNSYQSTVSWFAQWPDGRSLPLIVGPDGALYVGDYINSAIYRISYGP